MQYSYMYIAKRMYLLHRTPIAIALQMYSFVHTIPVEIYVELNWSGHNHNPYYEIHHDIFIVGNAMSKGRRR